MARDIGAVQAYALDLGALQSLSSSIIFSPITGALTFTTLRPHVNEVELLPLATTLIFTLGMAGAEILTYTVGPSATQLKFNVAQPTVSVSKGFVSCSPGADTLVFTGIKPTVSYGSREIRPFAALLSLQGGSYGSYFKPSVSISKAAVYRFTY